ncbi:CPCC family cysteine-rich protein [Candidatus Albibeggiatoa sp. nov. NOAA]|uniref:CPCC family cysteine-rich protein n=1 Tax=Candidatus Albibeggiatoa sp. nov. NOAA TaxID=3162724 RepID=UPI0032F20FE0|nr:CPCC family cysteine-rich protein [Thiotrichaceae bacterium]
MVAEEKLACYPCPCCGYFTLSEKPSGTFEICPVCNWEDDNVQYDDPNYNGGANRISLNTARENFAKYGVIDREFISKVRPPTKGEALSYYKK